MHNLCRSKLLWPPEVLPRGFKLPFFRSPHERRGAMGGTPVVHISSPRGGWVVPWKITISYAGNSQKATKMVDFQLPV